MSLGSNSLAKLDRQWRQVQVFLNSPRLLSGLPPFAQRVAMRFFDVDVSDILTAIRQGDVALFISMMVRIDQLHAAAVAGGRSLAEIAPIVRCRGTVEGFLASATERLQSLGGKWPLTDEVREESRDSRDST